MYTEKIVAVTVTFNDFEYLKKALAALRNQTVALSKIIVVDNCSKDEWKEKLKAEEDELVEVLWLESNMGGAGGFEAGMRLALERYDPDWYWLMDADAYPESNCVEKLLLHKDRYENVGILAPLIFGVDLKAYQLYHHKKMVNFLARDISMYERYEDIPETGIIEADAFVGPLVSRKAVKKLGIADGELFIYGDDLEYTYRVAREFPVVLVKDAVINHRDQPVNGVQQPSNWWKDYYMYRNRIIFIKKFARNKACEIMGVVFVLLRCAKQYAAAFALPYPHRLKKVRKKILVKSIMDGIRGKKGKLIDPLYFRKEVENNA